MNQEDMQITVVKDDIFHIFCPAGAEVYHSKAVEGEKRQDVPFTVTEEENTLVVKTRALTARMDHAGYIDFYKADGTLLSKQSRSGRKKAAALSKEAQALLAAEGHDVQGDLREYPVQMVREMGESETFYGLGDKTGFLNKRGYAYENWNTDNPQAHTEDFKALYKSVPFLIVRGDFGVYGIFFDNTYKSHINLGREDASYYFYGAEGGRLDYYFIVGKRMTDVVSNYTYLTGTTPLPPFWSLGHHQSRWGYESAEEICGIARQYRALRIPCDTIHFDIDYMDGYRVFTWNEKSFGEPGRVIGTLREEGFSVVTIIDPGVKLDAGYTVYEEGVAGDYFAKTPDGEIYVNEVWPGEAVYPDFGRNEVRAWWADKQQYLTGLGVRGVWNDMNEPASFRGELPKNVIFSDEDQPMLHEEMHNIYGHLMAKATYDGLKRANGKRPFVITRACYAGTQKYATVWTGDNQSLWSHLQMAVPQLCNLGLSGFSFAGTDIGGFGADCTAELMCRWVQLGTFMPLFRNHSAKGTARQEPWQFDTQTVDIYRKAVELRYRLLPYFYDLLYEGEKTGLPMMRPLVLHYENDENTWNLNGEFLVGEQLLVAPVLEQGAVKKLVYLPEGMWYDFYDGTEYRGGRYYMVDAPLPVCPLFAKAGSIIPMYGLMQHTGERTDETLKLVVFPGRGRYVHYQDNGEDFAYRSGAYNLYEFTSDANGHVEEKLLHEGYPRYHRVECSFRKGTAKAFE